MLVYARFSSQGLLSSFYIKLADNPRKLRWTILNRFIVADTDTLKYLNRFVI